MCKYIMQQTHKILNMFKIFMSVVRRKFEKLLGL